MYSYNSKYFSIQCIHKKWHTYSLNWLKFCCLMFLLKLNKNNNNIYIFQNLGKNYAVAINHTCTCVYLYVLTIQDLATIFNLPLSSWFPCQQQCPEQLLWSLSLQSAHQHQSSSSRRPLPESASLEQHLGCFSLSSARIHVQCVIKECEGMLTLVSTWN